MLHFTGHSQTCMLASPGLKLGLKHNVNLKTNACKSEKKEKKYKYIEITSLITSVKTNNFAELRVPYRRTHSSNVIMCRGKNTCIKLFCFGINMYFLRFGQIVGTGIL